MPGTIADFARPRASWLGRLAPLDAVGPDLLVQVRALDPEDDRGARDVPLEARQDLDDVGPLDPVAVLAEREPAVAGERGVCGRRHRLRARRRGAGVGARGAVVPAVRLVVE